MDQSEKSEWNYICRAVVWNIRPRDQDRSAKIQIRPTEQLWNNVKEGIDFGLARESEQ